MKKTIDEVMFEINEISNLENGKKYHLEINIPETYGWIDQVNLIIVNDTNYQLAFLKKENGFVTFARDISLDTRAIYNYFFSYTANGEMRYVKNNANGIETFKMSVNFETPSWANGALMYHIFVDRFYKGRCEALPEMPNRVIHTSWDEPPVVGPDKNGRWNTDFYGGDLQGIISKLDYLSELGVNILYLSPIVTSQSNHRYDTANYEEVDPYVGCNKDLKKLCDEAHQRNMKVILDAVFNHTGNDSIYFNEYNTYPTKGAYHHSDSPYRNFFRTHEADGKTQFDYWWGMPNLPVCNGDSLTWIEYITGVNGIIDRWFNLGIDGLRLDVADELTDNYIEHIRKAVKRNKQDGFILGEVWENPMRMNRGYLSSGKGLDTVMNYQLVDALIRYFKYADTYKLDYIIKDILREYPEDTIHTLMNFTSTHDISRALEIFGGDYCNPHAKWSWDLKNNDLVWCKEHTLTSQELQQGKAIYQAYVFALAFLPGILSIFYGDEVGVKGIGNLLNRQPFPWDNLDREMLDYFKMIGNIRQQEIFLKTADLNIFDINKDYFMFERTNEIEKILVTVSRTNDEITCPVPSEYLKSNKVYTLKRSRTGVLPPYGGIALKK